MFAEIISTGDELVLGQLTDTNARWLCERLTELGIRVTTITAVGDDLGDLTAAVSNAKLRLSQQQTTSIIILTGGLGPTDGDLTRHAIAQVTKTNLVEDELQRQILVDKLSKRGRTVTDRQLRQVLRPSACQHISNPLGTAPGLQTTLDATTIICLPGPPAELQAMWASSVHAELSSRSLRDVETRLLYVVGIAESDLADIIKDLTTRGGPTVVNITASGGVLTIRARAETPKGSTPTAHALVQHVVAEIQSRLGLSIVDQRSNGEHDGISVLSSAIIKRLTDHNATLTTVESCTGGMIAQLLTNVPGSSASVLGGLVTYSNNLKMSLAHVSEQTLAQHGAVSQQVATEMALGGLKAIGADFSIAVTGIAGPSGATITKPVGTVWIAIAHSHQRSPIVDARQFSIPGNRHEVRQRAAVASLIMLWNTLCARNVPSLLWQTR